MEPLLLDASEEGFTFEAAAERVAARVEEDRPVGNFMLPPQFAQAQQAAAASVPSKARSAIVPQAESQPESAFPSESQ